MKAKTNKDSVNVNEVILNYALRQVALVESNLIYFQTFHRGRDRYIYYKPNVV